MGSTEFDNNFHNEANTSLITKIRFDFFCHIFGEIEMENSLFVAIFKVNFHWQELSESKKINAIFIIAISEILKTGYLKNRQKYVQDF